METGLLGQMMIRERVGMRALPVEFLLGQLGGWGFLVGLAVVFTLLALGCGKRHLGRRETEEEAAEELVVCKNGLES